MKYNKIFLPSLIILWALMLTPQESFAEEQPETKTTIFVKYNNDFRINLSKLYIPVSNSIKVLDAEKGETLYLKTDGNYEIKVIGKAGDMYEIQVKKDGEDVPGTFLTAPANIKSGVNWAAVKAIVNGMDEIARGAVFQPICETDNSTPPTPGLRSDGSPSAGPYSGEDTSFSGVIPEGSDTYIPPSDGEFQPGCEVLTEQPISEDKSDKLETCVKSIQQAITAGNRGSNGQLNRTKVFKAMFSRLKPEEQAFAGYVFTALGESDMWVNKDNPEEAMFVMKVLQNRKEMALSQGAKEPYNVLDVALDPWQFSTYNANDPNWKKAIDPSRNTNFSGVVEAFRRMTDPELSKWEPKDQMDKVSHYRRNYLKEPWPSSKANRVRVYPKVNGVDLRSSSSTTNGAVGRNGYNYIYSNIDGPKHWIYTESTRGNWR